MTCGQFGIKLPNMDDANRLHLAVNAALMRLLRPLVRLLLRYHVPFSAFEELAKHAYVQAAIDRKSVV